MAKQKTNEQFIKEIKEKSELIEVLEEYKGCFEKIKFRCLKHNIEFTSSPSAMLKSCKCPMCQKEGFKKTITRTHEEFVEEFKRKNSKSSNIEILGKYINSKTKILCKCKVDGHVWKTRPKDLIQGSGCQKCGRKSMRESKLTPLDEVLKGIKDTHNGNISLIGDYTSCNEKSTFKCNICGYEWNTFPFAVINGNKCKNCSNIKMTKAHETFISELKNINLDIKPIEKYVGAHKKIKFKCLKCDNNFYTIPAHILNHKGCPICNSSKLERLTSIFLSKNNIKFTKQFRFADCINKKALPFDFYLNELNTIIECDGEQHYRPVEYFGGIDTFNQTKINDEIKNSYCKEKKIKLIRIPYWELKNIEKILSKELLAT